MKVYVLTYQTPDYSAKPGPPISVHATLQGAKEAFSKDYLDKWTGTSPRWEGPDGFGAIKEFEIQGIKEFD